MLFIDQHIHTDSSEDSREIMADMASAAAGAGLDTICFTDHCDLTCFNQANTLDPLCYDLWSRSQEEYYKLGRYPGLEIRIGMELGEINHDPAKAKLCYETEGLDFTLGSVHSIRGHVDFCLLEYKDQGECDRLIEQYLDENIETARLGHFDSLAHVGYTIRYMKPFGISVAYSNFEGRLKQLYGILIENGKALELNTSGLRQGADTTYPTLYMMKLYKQCGGELITIGSDAHRKKDVGSGLKEGIQLLSEAGFRYIAVYDKHKPSFVKL